MNVNDIERDLDAIRESGLQWIDIIDDTLNVPVKRFEDLVNLMIRKKYGFKWACYFRCRDTTDEIARLMAEAGCDCVFLGVESASPSILKAMNKKITREQIYRTIRAFKKAGVTIFASLIAGFPGETPETFQETSDMLQEAAPDFYKTNLWACHSVAPVWKKRREVGIKGSNFNWSHATMRSAQACDLMERQLISVDNSIYVPDGELWDMFYLVRQGWSIGEVKEYLKVFNTILRRKITEPDNEADPMLIENARRLVLKKHEADAGLKVIHTPLLGEKPQMDHQS
ncbi:MAG: radical SAM protein [Chitinivibrionales bacterium]|nr:radical SAM protein [Chitinivibrionales bacterium]MBD3358931.1 radical SAM protein [Chitinivibrionales bacterium]